MKWHMINFMINNILVIITWNFKLFTIIINFFFINDVSFSTVISVSVKSILIVSRILYVYLSI